mgnify:CR=1 FL=1
MAEVATLSGEEEAQTTLFVIKVLTLAPLSLASCKDTYTEEKKKQSQHIECHAYER